jgi:nitrous oxidase accessory protein NosD
MQRTTMSYMVATILTLAAVSGLAIQSSTQMTHAQAPTLTSSPACGQVVKGNVTLTADLNCPGDGLIVGADDAVIDLAGYSITGTGPDSSKVGIVVPNSDGVQVIGPGAIREFQAGILITGSDDTSVKRTTFDGNKIAVFMTGTTNTVVEQNMIGPNSIGVAAHSSDLVDVHANLMSTNNLAGVTFVNTDKSIIWANSVGGSANGIFTDAQSSKNEMKFNNVLGNTLDINNADGLALNINENTYEKNNCNTSNPVGVCVGT